MFTLGSISPEFDSWEPTTPALILDLAKVSSAYKRLVEALGPIDVHYAVKCNPTPQVLSRLLDLGSSFEVASVQELRLVLRAGAEARNVFFSAPVKAPADVSEARRLGVEIFSIDRESELDKVASCAPGASVQIRLATDDHASRWPLSRKFGASEAEAAMLAEKSIASGLTVDALSFHVGSQATELAAWRSALSACRRVMAAVAAGGHVISRINVGGGFPVAYVAEDVPTIEEIGAVIREELAAFDSPVVVACEPGRYLVADAGDTVASVIGVSDHNGDRWAYLDVGAFNGLFEASALGGGIQYEARVIGRELEVLVPFSIAGPTCDGDDVLAHPAELPIDLQVGEQVVLRRSGAYSLAYASNFCGSRLPLVTCIDEPVIDLREHASHARAGGVGQGYEFVRPTNRLFDEAKACELAVFQREGFVEESASSAGYDDFDKASTFVVAKQNGDIAAVLRLIWWSDRGFKTLEDLPLVPAATELVRTVGPERIVEIGSLAAVPSARGLGPATECLRGAFHLAMSRGISHFVTSLDAGLLETYRVGLCQRYVELGETQHYYGSPTTPVLLDLAEWADDLSLNRPDLFEMILLRSTSHRSQRSGGFAGRGDEVSAPA